MKIHRKFHSAPAAQRSRRAAFLMEALFALGLATILLFAISSSVGRLHKTQLQLSQRRAALRRLETGLLTLQTGQPIDRDLLLERLSTTAPAGKTWVRLSTPAGDAPAQSLVGLVADKNPPAVAPLNGGRP